MKKCFKGMVQLLLIRLFVDWDRADPADFGTGDPQGF